jgi:GTP:adenosylcobinamide-phosphate guanylyltransferase
MSDNTNDFIGKARKVHGDKYDYSKVRYVNNKIKVLIVCPKHGEFLQTPANHKSKNGCPNCGKDSLIRKNSLSIKGFIERARRVHGDKYDYSKVRYVNNRTAVKIMCPDHGEFFQIPSNHFNKNGCHDCYTVSLFHKHKVLLRSFNVSTKITVKYDDHINAKCSKNHEFKTTLRLLRAGNPCLKCRQLKTKQARKNCILDAQTGDLFYSNICNFGSKIILTCPNHGSFVQDIRNHLQTRSCPKCNCSTSKPEQNIADFIESLGFTIKRNDRKVLQGKELDVYIPELNLAIEYNGVYWHSEDKKNKSYHQDKYLACNKLGISLFQIREDLWLTKKEIIQSMIIYKLSLAERVFARKCLVNPVSMKIAKHFYNENHIQGAGQCYTKDMHIGLFFNNIMVMCVSVDLKAKYLKRLCTKQGLSVVGGASKLISKIPTGTWTTYSSNDLGGNTAQYRGVVSRTQTAPRYFWFKGSEIMQRQKVQKHKLANLYPEYDGTSEINWMHSLGYLRYFDAGNTKITFEVLR